MGLDIVEFVMGVEEAFALRIPDDVAATLTTPRRLIGYIHSQLPQSRESRCLSQRAFYAVRRALCERLGPPHPPFRPETELLAVLPARKPGTVWADVGTSLGCAHWPSLRRAAFLSWLVAREGTRTLGDMAQFVATITPGTLKPSGEGWSWHEVMKVVDGLMYRHFAIRTYSLDDCFVEDLGLD